MIETYMPLPITLTDSAKQQYRNIITSSEPYLRLSIKGGGCSGFEICFSLEETTMEDDTVVDVDSAGVIIDPVSLSYLTGSTVDYKVNLAGSMFIVNSPLATGTCGCGASISF